MTHLLSVVDPNFGAGKTIGIAMIGGNGIKRAPGQPKLTALSFHPPSAGGATAPVLGAAPGSVGHVVAIDRTSGFDWSYSTVASTNQRYGAYVFDRTHSIAYALREPSTKPFPNANGKVSWNQNLSRPSGPDSTMSTS